jgi:hypothetical protein
VSAPHAAPGTLGYDRALEWKEPPSSDESGLRGWSVVRAAGTPAASWLALARIGQVRLHLAPPGTLGDARWLYSEPVIAAKRGNPTRGGYVGVDGRVRTAEVHRPPIQIAATVTAAAPPAPPATDGSAPVQGRPPMPARTSGARSVFAPRPAPPPSPPTRQAPEIRVAVIDVSFDNLALLGASNQARLDGPFIARLGPEPPPPPRPLSASAGHGAAMAGIILHEVAGARVGLFQIPGAAGAVPAYAAATYLAIAVAQSVECWRADVVVIAMSDGAWGTPRHLREVLREAARGGRGGRGTSIFCSVGDPSKNHSHADDSAALGADDLASQPWVLAVAACDQRGRWQRAEFEYRDAGAPGATYNRLGPSVALAASGEARRYGDRIAADDSSQASALAAAAAARVLAAAPETHLDPLRAILTITADVAAISDGGRGLAGGAFEGRDRLGHSFKLGYGRVNAAAATLGARDPIALALLATRPCPDACDGAPSFAQRLAEGWEAALRRWLDGARAVDGESGLAAGYARVRGALVGCALQSRPAWEALIWLARHLRAVAESGCGSWFSAAQDHGALIDRIRHAAEVLAQALPPNQRDAARWLARLEAALGDPAEASGQMVAGVVAVAVGRAMERALMLQTRPDFVSDSSPAMPTRMDADNNQPRSEGAQQRHGRCLGNDGKEATS